MRPSANSVGIYGKIPAQGDFVRINASSPCAMALDTWVQEGLEALSRAGSSLSEDPTYFVFKAHGQNDCAVGVMAPSSDRVGRKYPLVVFAEVNASALAALFPAIPVAFARFFAEGANIVQAAAQWDPARLPEQAQALNAHAVLDVDAAIAVCQRTLNTPAGGEEMQRRLFGPPTSGLHYYAFKTVLDACGPARGAPPAKPGVTLSCPIASDVDLFAWLDLSRRALQWRDSIPSFVWSEGETPKLLLSVGPSPAALLSYLVKPSSSAAKLWPVTTSSPEAIATARAGLPDAVRATLDAPGLPLENMLGALAR